MKSCRLTSQSHLLHPPRRAQALPRRFGALAPDDFAECDCLVVMGTSLQAAHISVDLACISLDLPTSLPIRRPSVQVRPFALLVDFPSAGTPRLLINRHRVGPFRLPPPDCETPAGDAVFEGDCDAGVAALATLAGWRDELDARAARARALRFRAPRTT